MRPIPVLLGAAALVLAGAGASALADGPDDRVRPVVPAAEISGPCDEAEHANDPRCTGDGDGNDDADDGHSGPGDGDDDADDGSDDED